jgi:hypothetical protein
MGDRRRVWVRRLLRVGGVRSSVSSAMSASFPSAATIRPGNLVVWMSCGVGSLEDSHH